jgi:hypothetical protein
MINFNSDSLIGYDTNYDISNNSGIPISTIIPYNQNISSPYDLHYVFMKHDYGNIPFDWKGNWADVKWGYDSSANIYILSFTGTGTISFTSSISNLNIICVGGGGNGGSNQLTYPGGYDYMCGGGGGSGGQITQFTALNITNPFSIAQIGQGSTSDSDSSGVTFVSNDPINFYTAQGGTKGSEPTFTGITFYGGTGGINPNPDSQEWPALSYPKHYGGGTGGNGGTPEQPLVPLAAVPPTNGAIGRELKIGTYTYTFAGGGAGGNYVDQGENNIASGGYGGGGGGGTDSSGNLNYGYGNNKELYRTPYYTNIDYKTKNIFLNSGGGGAGAGGNNNYTLNNGQTGNSGLVIFYFSTI